ncbi:MAG: NAD(P)-binding protein, partial [Syntrophales bacterium]|nr:NAD(P)-binding protein [Syntrophales bacterium]
KLIQKRMEELNLNRLVVSSCSPRTHEPLFRETIREVGVNPYLFEMANIRDQCSWVHMGKNKEATEKAKRLVSMAVASASNLEPLHCTERSLINNCLVVGGGLAGMISALNLADQGFLVYLLDREKELGGSLRQIHYSAQGEDPHLFLEDIIKRVETHPRIEVLTGYRLAGHNGAVGNFKTKVLEVDGPRQMVIEHGTAIIASGGKEYRGKNYLLGNNEQVITQSDLENKLVARDPALTGAKSIVMIQCAGPWDDDPSIPFYCSRICCALALKNALKMKELNPEISIIILYKDMRAYGFKESIYTEARAKGILFIRFDDRHKPLVASTDGSLCVEVEEPMLRLPLMLTPDILVLSQAIVPSEGS